MSDLRQVWLVASREMRERSRSRAFQASFLVTILATVGLILVPALLDDNTRTHDIGLAGSVPQELFDAIENQSTIDDIAVRLQRFDSVAAGEEAVRQGDLDVLVVDAQRLEWRRQTEDQLAGLLTGAIQAVAVSERAAAAGIDTDDLLALVAPVPIENVALGSVAGRSPDDELAVLVMTVVLFIAISTFGNLVLTGVVEEKANRVVEVLLARMPASNLLAGKVIGIGLLGLAQIGVTALAALVSLSMVDSVDMPAARGAVLAWVVVWFVLGYALYATVYGALGSLASRTEDAQAVAGPVIAVLVVGYFASFAAVGRPDSFIAQFASYFPPTAPLTMPSRIAMGATAWWEPIVAVALTLAAIAAFVMFGARVYAGAVLHVGPTLKLRQAWRSATASAPGLATPVDESEAEARRSGRPPRPAT